MTASSGMAEVRRGGEWRYTRCGGWRGWDVRIGSKRAGGARLISALLSQQTRREVFKCNDNKLHSSIRNKSSTGILSLCLPA
jgi:hypothetical protein